ncbi:MAG: hypothetical protein J5I35_08790 [Methanothrix harundinacea]|nr:hypothetical protein [Methanothrix harundinacea]
MKGPSKKKDAEAKIKNASGNFVKSSCKRALRLTLTLLVLGAFATSAAVANDPPVAVDLSSDKASPQTVGTPINFEAAATDPDGDTLQYQFWVKGPGTGNAWQIKRPWSTDKFWTWTPTASDVGNNEIDFWVRDGNHAGPDSFDSEKLIPFTIQPPSNQPPVVTALTPSRASPQIAGTRVTWTASASDPDGDQILYRFWMKGPSTGNIWKVVRDWSSSRTWTWSTSSGDAGQYDFCVYVRDGKHQPAGRYDDCTGYKGYQLIVVRPVNQPPVVKALSPSRSSPSTAGSTVVWTASASDPERDLLYYKFWLRGPSTGNSWTVARDWSTSSTWTWSSSPGDAGSYDVYVYVRDGRHEPASGYDSAKGYGGYRLTAPAPASRPPTVTALSPSRPSPQAAGSTIVWTASATDPDGDPLLYKFWMKGPSTENAWQVVQDWTASPSWTWSSAPGDAGEYSLYVYVRDGKHEPASRYDSAIGYSGYQLVSTGGVYQLTSGAAIQDRPSLIFADDGYLLAYQSWETGSLYSGDIFMKRFDPRWAQLQKVAATDDPAYQDTPSAIFSDGYYYVAYVSDETGNWDIFVKKYDRNLNLVETRRITTSPADQDSPSLVRAGGDFYLAYQSWETGSSYGGDIFIERFNSAWTPIRKMRVTTETSYQDRPSLAYSTDDDRLYIAYASDETEGRDIFVKKYDRSLNSLEKRRITSSSSIQDYPSLVVQSGEFDLVYSSQEGGSRDLYLGRFGPDWSLIERVPLTGTSGDELWPSLIYSPFDGLLWVAYVLQDAVGGDIFVQPARSMTGCWASMDFSAMVAYSPYTLTARFYGPTGELVDPSSLRLTWSPADAVLTSSTLRKVSTGTYQLQSRFGSAGLKTFTLSSAVNGCSAENTVTVQVA